MTFTKSQAVELVTDRIGFTKNKSVDVVEQLLEIIKKSLESGNDVMISNFGKFHVAEKTQRKGRNPATGKTLILLSRRVITFKASNTLREKLTAKTVKNEGDHLDIIVSEEIISNKIYILRGQNVMLDGPAGAF